MSVEGELESICEALPVFPLPRLVLMPGEQLPLHIFEPRYRQMLAHCLSTDRVLGLATLLDGEDDEGRPRIAPEVGVGRIVAHEPLAGGRANIVLQYVARGHIVDELDSPHAFRLVRLGLDPALPAPGPTDVASVRALVRQIAASNERLQAEGARLFAMPPADMIDDLARRVLDGDVDRRAYLAARSWGVRAGLVAATLATVIGGDRTPVAEA